MLGAVRIGCISVWGDCGAGHVTRAFRDALATEHEVFIYARGSYTRAQRDPFWDDGTVTWDPIVGTVSRLSLRRYLRWLDERRIDVALFNEQRWWRAVVETVRQGVTAAAYIDYYTGNTVPLFELYDLLVCNTQRHLSVFENHPGAVYVPWGTDTRTFVPGERFGKRHDEVVFFHSAGLGGPNDRKGTGYVLDAFVRVDGPARLLLHTQRPEGELPARWQERIRSDRRIELISVSAKPPGFYARGDVYVYPTRLEGIGLTIAEALASGLPVITTDHAPMNEFVVDGVNGALVPVEKLVGRYDGYYWPESPCSIDALVGVMQSYVGAWDRILREQAEARAGAVADRDWLANARSLPELFLAARKHPSRDARWDELVRRARLQDRVDEPSPTELLRRGFGAIARQLLSLVR